MNKYSLLGWTALIGLLLLWTGYKSRAAQEDALRRMEQSRIDSVSNAGKTPAAAPSASADTAVTVKGKAELRPPADDANGASAPAAVSKPVSPDSTRPSAPRQLITVETDHFVVQLDNQGAKVASLSVKDIAGKRPDQPRLIDPEKGGALSLSLDNVDLGQALWGVDTRDTLIRVSGDSLTITFTYATAKSGNVSRRYVFFPGQGLFRHRFQAEIPPSSYTLHWPAGLDESEKMLQGKGFGLTSSFYSEVVLDNGVTVQRATFEGEKTFNAESGVLRWVGLRRKYVAAVIDFNRETHNKVAATAVAEPGGDASLPKAYRLQISGADFEERDLNFDFAVLPLSYAKLLALNRSYEKIIFSGWEWFFRADVWYVALCGMVLDLLNFFHGLVPNYGVAIILLTLLVRIVTLPLTIAQTKSAAKMQEHAPAIRKIREKHKGAPQKANQEVMEYYKQVGVSPFAGMMGCFPALLQMPIFIALFNVLGRAVELKNAPFAGWISDLSYPDVVWPSLQVPYLFPLGLTILPFFMAGTMYFQMKMTIKDPNQKFMVWMMPIMMFVFSCSFPSGLVVYWTVSNVFTIGQTYFYMRRIPAAPTVEISTRPSKKR